MLRTKSTLFTLDSKKALNMINSLNEYFQSNNQDAEIEIPDSIIYGSEEHFVYLFYSCLLDYGMRSKCYHKNLINTYQHYPKIFEPKYVVSLEGEQLLYIIQNSIHHRYPNVAFKKWLSLSRQLLNYESLKYTILKMKNSQELESFIKSIDGYGQKTGGLLLRSIVELKITPFSQVESIPLDRHDLSICYGNGITNKNCLNPSEIQELNDLLVDLCKKNGIRAIDLDKNLWTIGNSFCTKKSCQNCPLKESCQNKKYL